MTASFAPAGAAEFPNDNPALHRGARWVCLAERGPARAVWQASDVASAAEPPSLAQPLEVAPEREVAATRSGRARAARDSRTTAPRRCDGPIQLDLHRIVLPHRVEDVPPPPDFIYTPLVSSRAPLPSPSPSPRPIDPSPCRVVDTRQANERVQRGWRVDVAPCLPVGSGERRPSRHRGGVVACPAPRLPSLESVILELQAASA